LDVEAFRYTALERAWKEATLPSEREHVTPYIWNNPKIFKLENVKYKIDLSKYRWTLDYEEDLKFAQEIYKRLYKGGVFGMEEILQIVTEDPQLSEINSGFTRNAGYLKSKNSEIVK
jgi:spore coat polysaccharide biosynthesis protein SpsF (cytidylyltransferase family)